MTTLEQAARPSRIITIEFDGEDIDDAERAFDAIEVLLGDMGQIGTLHMGPETPSIPASALLDPSDEVVEAMCRAYLAVEGLNPDERTNTGEAHWTFYRDHMRACLRAAGVKITGSQG